MNFSVRSGLALSAVAARPLRAQLTYPACDALKSSDFRVEELFNKKGRNGAVADPSLSEPTRMDVHVVYNPDGSYKHTDVIFVERLGSVKWYDGAYRVLQSPRTTSWTWAA